MKGLLVFMGWIIGVAVFVGAGMMWLMNRDKQGESNGKDTVEPRESD